MRRFFTLLFTIVLVATTAKAGEATTDHFTVSALQTQGSYTYFTVSLVGTRNYTAYNMDIHLPNGVSPTVYNNNIMVTLVDGIYPASDPFSNTKLHTIGATWDVVGDQILRIVCNSTTNAEFNNTSGVLFRAYVNVSPYAKAGTNEITIDNANLIVKEGATQYDPADEQHSIDLGTDRSLTLNISSDNKWSTCVLPFDHTLPSGVQAYTCAGTSGEYLAMDEATTLEAYKPYILYAENGYTGNLSGTADANKYVATATVGLLNGAVVARELTEGYVLQNINDDVRFYNIDGQTFVIPEGRCWLTVPDEARLSYRFGDDATAVTAPLAADAAPEVYDLNGRRVSQPQPGHIYIIGGRKMLKFK